MTVTLHRRDIVSETSDVICLLNIRGIINYVIKYDIVLSALHLYLAVVTLVCLTIVICVFYTFHRCFLAKNAGTKYATPQLIVLHETPMYYIFKYLHYMFQVRVSFCPVSPHLPPFLLFIFSLLMSVLHFYVY